MFFRSIERGATPRRLLCVRAFVGVISKDALSSTTLAKAAISPHMLRFDAPGLQFVSF
jgi:hypothetical protein